MSISMYQTAVPVFLRALGNLKHVLEQGQAHAKEKKVEDSVMLQSRLIADMLPLVKQVLKFEDNETTFDELLSRIDRAVDYIKSFKAEQIDGSETRAITIPSRNGEVKFEGQAYLLHFVLPNVFFHCTTAYNILRVAGANIGKTDFIGKQ
jgi:hypothetical protein